ncbi:hypothetical protein KSS87_006250, partial [Heliosperma pusillum]
SIIGRAVQCRTSSLNEQRIAAGAEQTARVCYKSLWDYCFDVVYMKSELWKTGKGGRPMSVMYLQFLTCLAESGAYEECHFSSMKYSTQMEYSLVRDVTGKVVTNIKDRQLCAKMRSVLMIPDIS